MAGRKRARSVGTVEGVRGVGQDEGIGADIDCPGGEARLAEELAPKGMPREKRSSPTTLPLASVTTLAEPR